MRELQKKRRRDSLLQGFVNTRNRSKRSRKVEIILRSPKAWWRMGSGDRLNGESRRRIMCLSTMKGKLLKLQVNFIWSSVHSIRRCTDEGAYKLEEALLRLLSFLFWASSQSVFGDCNQTYPAAYWLHCGVGFLPIHFLSMLRTIVVKLYAILTSSSHAKDVGVWDVGCIEAQLFSFVYLALWTNRLHCKPYSLDCGASVWFGLVFQEFCSRQHHS